MTQRKIQQFAAILDLIRAFAGQGATRRQIADALGLKKSVHVTNLLRLLVTENYISEVLDDSEYPPRFRYFIIE